MSLAAACWPIERIGDALSALARASGLALDARELPEPGPSILADPDDSAIDRWMAGAAATLSLEAEAIDTDLAGVGELVRQSAPALLRIGFAETVAYRAEFVVWMLTTTMPLVMLGLWTSVAAEAPFRGFGQRDFVAYYLATLIVRNVTSSWVVWQINEEIRQGNLSMRLLRPIHPFASYAATHLSAVPLRTLMEQSDGVCMLLAFFTRYRGLVGERYLADCKPNQVLVSLTHSSIFEEAALAEALDSGRMAAAWLDSLEPGALDPGRPLHGAETLQVTPRVASTTRESRRRSAWSVARRIDEILADTNPAPVFRPTWEGDVADLADD